MSGAAEAARRKKADEEAELLSAELGMGVYELKGDRGYMEDRLIVCRLPNGDLFAGVYDGHCGEGCAQYAKESQHHTRVATAEYARGDVGEALRSIYHKTSDDFMEAAAASSRGRHARRPHSYERSIADRRRCSRVVAAAAAAAAAAAVAV